MKTFNYALQLIILMASSHINADDCVNCLNPNIIKNASVDKAAIGINQVITRSLDEKTVTEFLKQGSIFLNKNVESTSFSEDEANSHIKNLESVMAKMDLSARTRARAQLLCSGIIGRMADKKKSGALGSKSYHMTRDAMRIDPNYREAKTAYISAVSSISNKNIVSRKFIESSLNVSLISEAQKAMKILNEEKWHNDAEMKSHYKQLQDFLK